MSDDADQFRKELRKYYEEQGIDYDAELADAVKRCSDEWVQFDELERSPEWRKWEEQSRAAECCESTAAQSWHFSWICQRPTAGSRWYRGNFTLGLVIDSHPRFVNVIVGLLLVEVGVSWEKY